MGPPRRGSLFSVQGGTINELTNWTVGEAVQTDGDWTVELLDDKLGALAAA